ncbi:hypothetical protein NF716_07305 [Lactococcus formosensis]|uniref:hypothetical protein n=1 Tax=Lactococcus formosensis TaxID=1281486 RepID=UPI0024354D51|nr:hypothetical protein [Lactococcus formosensis]MDG6156155.1 hypothetical protein [Lactococcus formosensis]
MAKQRRPPKKYKVTNILADGTRISEEDWPEWCRNNPLTGEIAIEIGRIILASIDQDPKAS